MSRFSAIHFDMDGVIADTEPLHVAAEQQTCRDFGLAINPDDWSGFKGMTAQRIFHHLVDEYGDPKKHVAEELIAHKTKLFIESIQKELKPIEGVLEFLEWARQHHAVMNLVTSSNRQVQESVIGILGIGHYFDHIITGDDVEFGKPHPEPYLLSLQRSGAHPGGSIIIEDSTHGIESGLAAGCSVLAITTSYPADVLREALPTHIANDYMHARELL